MTHIPLLFSVLCSQHPWRIEDTFEFFYLSYSTALRDYIPKRALYLHSRFVQDLAFLACLLKYFHLAAGNNVRPC